MPTEPVKATDTEELPTMGRFYLLRRDNKPGAIIYLHEYQEGTGRAPGYSLRTRDATEAAALLYAKWLDDVKPPQNQPDAPLIDVFNRYLNSVANKMPSRKAACYALRFIEAHFAEKTVKQIDADLQLEVIEKMRTELPPEPMKPTGKERKPLTDSTILRVFGTIFAAINRAKNIGWLPVVPPMVSRKLWKPRISGRKKLLSVPLEVCPLYRTAWERGIREGEWSWWDGLIELTGTGARPTAARQITGAQVDLPRRNLDLLVPGTHQEPKKFRPIIRMCETLQFWAERWVKERGTGQLLLYKGKPVKSLKWFGALAAQAGLPGVTAYHFRHLVSTWLIEHRVSFAEKNAVLGQEQTEEAKAGHDYTHLSPDYQINAAAAIELLFEAIGAGLDVPLAVRQFKEAEKKVEEQARVLAEMEEQPRPETAIPMVAEAWAFRREIPFGRGVFSAELPSREHATPQMLRSDIPEIVINQLLAQSLPSLSGLSPSSCSITYDSPT